MNLRDWFYKQIVTQDQMDESYGWAEDADHDSVVDQNMWGLNRVIGTEWDSSETSPASLSMEVSGGPHRAYGKTGERIYLSNAVETLDCSVDEYGVSTSVVGAANSRYLSVFVRFKRLLADPEVDGSSVLVYTRKYEDAELFVRQGAEAVAPTKPALLSDALLVCDIELAYAQTTIQNTHIDTDRTEWWYSKTGMASLSDHIGGNVKVTLEALWDALDTVAGGGGPFTFSSTWFGGTPVGSSPTTVSAALNAIVSDLAASSGSPLIGTPNVSTTYVSWTSQSVGGALSAIATAVNGHIGGAAPYHPASAVTFNDALGTPSFATWSARSAADVQEAFEHTIEALYDYAGATDGASRLGLFTITDSPESFTAGDLRTAMTQVYGHLNDRTERATTEVVSAPWQFLPASGLDELQVSLPGAPWLNTLNGGGQHVTRQKPALCAQGYTLSDAVGLPNANCSKIATGEAIADVVVIAPPGSPSTRRPRKVCVVDAKVDAGQAGTGVAGGYIREYDPNTHTNTTFTMGSLPTTAGVYYGAVSACSDGTNIYVLFFGTDGAGTYYKCVQAYDSTNSYAKVAAWPATGLDPTPGGTPLWSDAVYPSEAMTSKIIVASNTKIATSNGWVPIDVAGNPAVSVFASADGSGLVSGDGDLTAAANKYPLGGICSDGVFLYFLTYIQPSGTMECASASITAPGSGGKTGFPLNAGALLSKDVINVGSALVFGTTSSVLRVYDLVGQAWSSFTAAATLADQFRTIATDGHYLWILGDDGLDMPSITQVPLAALLYPNSQTLDVVRKARWPLLTATELDAGGVDGSDYGRMCFDGTNLWIPLDAGQTAGTSAHLGECRKIAHCWMK